MNAILLKGSISKICNELSKMEYMPSPDPLKEAWHDIGINITESQWTKAQDNTFINLCSSRTASVQRSAQATSFQSIDL